MSKNDIYGDIINLPYRKSARHPQMPLRDRAAQFAPFAALSGYGESIEETGLEAEEDVLNEVEHIPDEDYAEHGQDEPL